MKNRLKKIGYILLHFAEDYFPTLVIPLAIAILLLHNNYYTNILLNIEYFESKNFDSLGYTVLIFILGIIITLKTKIFDFKGPYKPFFKNLFRKFKGKNPYERNNRSFRKNEFIAFSIFTFLNIIYLCCAFFSSCIDDKKNLFSILLAFIVFDFVVLIRNIFIVGKIYCDEIFNKNNVNNFFDTLKIDRERIENEMHHLEKILNYRFYNIELLAKAMYAKKTGTKKMTNMQTMQWQHLEIVYLNQSLLKIYLRVE